jgi:predicted dehydrogenase
MGSIQVPSSTFTARDFYRARVQEVSGERTIRHIRETGHSNYLPGQLDEIRQGKTVVALQDGGLALIGPRLFRPAIEELYTDLKQAPPIEFVISDIYTNGSFSKLPIWLRTDDGSYNGSVIIERAIHALSTGNEEFTHGLQMSNLPYLPKSAWAEAFTGNGIVSFGGREAKVDIGLVTTPPVFHLDGADGLKNAGIDDVYVEKPWGPSLDSELPNRIAAQVERGIFGVDFFAYGDSMEFLKRRPELLDGLGALQEVHAVCSEPWPPEPGRGLTSEKVMGSGVFADTASHSAAIADDFLRWRYGNEFGLNTASLSVFERSRLHGFEGDAHLETFGTTVGSSIRTHEGPIKIVLAGGKGTGGRLGGKDGGEYPFLGMTLIFEKGRVEVSLGFPKRYNPYVAIIYDNKTVPVRLFEIMGGKLGYNAMFADWISRAQGSKIANERIHNVSLASQNAMGYLTRAYNEARGNNFRIDGFYHQGTIPGRQYAIGHASPLIGVNSDQSAFEVLGNSRENDSSQYPFTGKQSL